MNPATDDPMPESPDSRPRLGDLLLSAGLITEAQLEASLTLARAAGKPLGHVLVEQGLVPSHSVAMALADQHGGPLKTEYGFATGRGTTPRPTSLQAEALPVLRLAPAPPNEAPAPTAALEAETAARLSAEASAKELLAHNQRLEAELEEQTATEGLLATTRSELATATAVAEELRLKLAAEHAANERAATAVDELSAQVEELRKRRSADAAAFSAGEGALVSVHAELAAARAEAETLRTTLSAERETHRELTAAADALRNRVTELERAAQEAQASVVPLHEELDELRAVIELQEQALAAAAARELARDGDARHLVDNSSTRAYSEDAHFLFAPSAEGYELLERSGPAPSPDDVVELSGSRTCRVLRVGPPPFPGAPQACAYLELV